MNKNKTKIIIANWKMNPKNIKQAENLLIETLKINQKFKNIDIVVCPPFPYLFLFNKIKNKKLKIGSQNISREIKGSFTGEVSGIILKEMGVSFVIIGHQERRALGEDNLTINQKVKQALSQKMDVVFCVGENFRDKEGDYFSFVGNQIKEGLSDIPKNKMKNIIIAYEPVWSVGENAVRVATKEEFFEMKIFIKKLIHDFYGKNISDGIKIIYGGSIDKDNAKDFMSDELSGGLLIGRQSLIPKNLEAIIKSIY